MAKACSEAMISVQQFFHFAVHVLGVKKLTTETGAGQWGSALAFATCLLDMQCEVSLG